MINVATILVTIGHIRKAGSIMDERVDLYNKIIDEYRKTGSVKTVVNNLNTNTIKVRKVLITEGLWKSKTSRKVGELYSVGKTTKEIAQELFMSEKNVQSYIPYSRGAYGGEKSNDAERSGEYRARMKNAAANQASITESGDIEIEKEIVNKSGKIVQFSRNEELIQKESGIDTPQILNPDLLPVVLKLRFEIVAPYYTRKGSLDMEPDEEAEFLRLAKAQKGIIREVLVPGDMNLHALHYMIQRLFGWQNSHLHHFSLSDPDFDMVTDDQKLDEYLKLCGTLFQFPGADYDDRFWDDDYIEGISVKSWLRSKYTYGYRDLSVENSFLRNGLHINTFRERFKEKLNKRGMTLEKVRDLVAFESGYNTVIESASVRNLFVTAYPKDCLMTVAKWRVLQSEMIQVVAEDYDEFRERFPDDYGIVMDALDNLMTIRKNLLAVEKAVRYGQEKKIRDFYKKDPEEVISEMWMVEDDLEYMLESFLAEGNPRLIPFAKELFYNYDYGDDWCVKITCVDAYTSDDGSRLNDTSLNGMKADPDLIEKINKVYSDFRPLCVMADGLNVMDDVGGIYGYQDFLRVINSNAPEDREEKEESKLWAKGMGWTGRKTKPENIL